MNIRFSGTARLCALMVVVSVCSVRAQQVLPPSTSPACQADRIGCAYERPLSALLNAYATGDATAESDALKGLLNPWTYPDSFVLALTGQDLADQLLTKTVAAWQDARVDQQIGPALTGKGSTDLVSRPSATDLVAMAMQTGALTQTVSGTTATFQANAGGAYKALIGRPVVCPECSPLKPFDFDNLNVSVSFDVSGQSTSTVSTSGSANSVTTAPASVLLPQSASAVSQVDLKYNILNPLDPRSKHFQDAWTDAFKKHSPDLAAAAVKMNTDVLTILNPLILDADQKLKILQGKYTDEITRAAAANNSDQVRATFENYFQQLAGIARSDVPDLDEKVSSATGSIAAYSQLNYAAVEEATGSQLTLEYAYNRSPGAPDTHDIRFIYGYTPKSAAAGTLFTLNVAASLYGGQLPSGARYGRLRDVQAAGQFDRPVGDRITHPATFSLAGYMQYQQDPSVLNITAGNLTPGTSITLPNDAQVLLGSSGVLAVVQAKITLNMSGVDIPIGIEWANKTDLLDASDVRGNIGLTYNFDSLSKLFGH